MAPVSRSVSGRFMMLASPRDWRLPPTVFACLVRFWFRCGLGFEAGKLGDRLLVLQK